jgi:hypothetical protein
VLKVPATPRARRYIILIRGCEHSRLKGEIPSLKLEIRFHREKLNYITQRFGCRERACEPSNVRTDHASDSVGGCSSIRLWSYDTGLSGS